MSHNRIWLGCWVVSLSLFLSQCVFLSLSPIQIRGMLKHLIDFSTPADNLLLTDLEFFGFRPVRSELMIWAHRWGKTACDSLSYRSEHNEEDTAINSATPSPNTTKKGKKKHTREGRRERREGGWEKHIINTNTPLNYFKRDFGQFVELVLRKKQKGKQICLRGGKQTSANDTICHIFWMEEYSVVCLTEAFFPCQSHNMPLLS